MAKNTFGRSSLSLALAATTAIVVGAAAQAQDFEISVYSGWQSAPHSVVSGDDIAGVGPFSFTAGWEGRPFAAPPHYGFRATWWRSGNWGLTADFNHTKVYADAATLGAGGTSGGFEVLEFSDGLNNLTFGAVRRWQDAFMGLTPYAGASLGVAIPHVEVQSSAVAPMTFEYQVAGPSMGLVAGVSKPISEKLSVFGEYKFTYSQVSADLVGGGTLKTDVITNAINFGITYGF